MDNWADVWADNADPAKTPSKTEVTSPLPPAFAPAPNLLNGFLDDAGWGNDEESSGDWSAAPAQVEDAVHEKRSMTDTYGVEKFEHVSSDNFWSDKEKEENDTSALQDDWAGLELDAPKDDEKVVSETSDSSTTIQPEHSQEDTSIKAPPHATSDDVSSTRASTSPSETSHNEVAIESPRTSYEDERVAAKVITSAEDAGMDSPEATSSAERTASGTSQNEAENAPEDTVEADDNQTLPRRAPSPTESSSGSPGLSDGAAKHSASPTAGAAPPQGADTYVVNLGLLHALFAPAKEVKETEDAPDDPIYSTSSRKAWYRLTRRQTMREYNNGNDDDNYIRVTWAHSNVRSEVDKIVGRWAREDRLSGRGPGARASFYWDTPAPTDSRPSSMYASRQSSQPVSNVIAPAQGGPPHLSTNAPAAFNWSSPSTSIDPWHQSGSAPAATSTSTDPPRLDQLKVHGSGSRDVVMDPTSHKPKPTNGMQTWSAADETPAAASLISPPPSEGDSTATSSDPWAGLDTFDTDTAPKEQFVDAPVDDDDEWGEMVSTPTVPASSASATTLQTTLANSLVSTPATPVQSFKSISSREDSPDAMHAAPIVRLRSTISPTSALFKANSFMPLGIEQGPIGPGILKSTKRLASLNVEKTAEKPPSAAQPMPVVAPEEIITSSTHASDDFAAWQSPDFDALPERISHTGAPPPDDEPPMLQEQPARPSTPPPQTADPMQLSHDAWADADFSFFESALPVSTPQRVKQDPSDLPSRLESPPKSTSSASSAKTFTRSPPRKITPPPVQPLTGATSSAQRRKNEEDQILHDILRGLPDLSYMLR